MRKVKLLSVIVVVVALFAVMAFQIVPMQLAVHAQVAPPVTPGEPAELPPPDNFRTPPQKDPQSNPIPVPRDARDRKELTPRLVDALPDNVGATPAIESPLKAIPEPEPINSPQKTFRDTSVQPPGLQPGRASIVDLKTTVHRLGELNALQVAEVVKALFSDRPGFIVTAEPRTNTLILRADTSTLRDILQLVERLEETQREVTTEAGRAAVRSDVQDMVEVEQALLTPVETQQNIGQQQQTVRRNQMSQSTTSRFGLSDPDGAMQWSTLQQFEVESHAIARNLQAALTMYADEHPEVRQMREQLRLVLEQAFQLRADAQQREVDSLTRRLETVRGRLRRRGELRDQIIDRRLTELTGAGDETVWAPAPTATIPRVGAPQQRTGQLSPSNRQPNFAPVPTTSGQLDRDDLNTPSSTVSEDPLRATSETRLETTGSLIPVPVNGLPGAALSTFDLLIRQRLAESRVQAQVAESDYQRLSVLRQTGAISQAELQKSQNELAKANVTFEETKRLLELQLKTLASRVQLAEKSVQLAQHEVDLAELANEKIPGAIPLTEILKLALEVERARTVLSELKSVTEFLAGPVAQSPARELNPDGIDLDAGTPLPEVDTRPSPAARDDFPTSADTDETTPFGFEEPSTPTEPEPDAPAQVAPDPLGLDSVAAES